MKFTTELRNSRIRRDNCIKLSSKFSIFLQVVKTLSRNSLASTILGREGIVPLVTNIVTKLVKSSYGPRLKVAVEALSLLTKTSKSKQLKAAENLLML